MHRVAIGSVGDHCGNSLKAIQLFPDITAPSLEALMAQTQSAESILDAKNRRANEAWVRTQNPQGAFEADSPFYRACLGQANQQVPIWLMRQAGRYMAEYQLVRSGRNFLEFCKNPDLAAQATLDAVERLNVDAAIIFSDILLIVEPMGQHLAYQESVGPVISNPVRTRDDVEKLKTVNPKQSMPFLYEAIAKVRRNLSPKIPLIGFSGAPFTMASYMVEGRGSKEYAHVKRLMAEDPKAFNLLLEKITTAHIDYLNAQVEAGCQALQIFDSWAGALTPDEYRSHVLPHTQRLVRGITPGVPVIHFASGSDALLEAFQETGAKVLSLDWKIDLAGALRRVQSDRGIQGNLDPNLLFSKPEVFLPEVEKILKIAGNRPGFIFNLGHGILQKTPVDHVMALVDFVKNWKIR